MIRTCTGYTLYETTHPNKSSPNQETQGFAGFSETLGSPEAHLLEAYPFLCHLPDALLPIKKRARELHEKELQLFLGHWLNAKKKIQDGTANVRCSSPYQSYTHTS